MRRAREGQVAALLNQQRPNIFTQVVANILPGQQIKVTISYVETLKYDGGSLRVVVSDGRRTAVYTRVRARARNLSREPNDTRTENAASQTNRLKANPLTTILLTPSLPTPTLLRPRTTLKLPIAKAKAKLPQPKPASRCVTSR